MTMHPYYILKAQETLDLDKFIEQANAHPDPVYDSDDKDDDSFTPLSSWIKQQEGNAS